MATSYPPTIPTNGLSQEDLIKYLQRIKYPGFETPAANEPILPPSIGHPVNSSNEKSTINPTALEIEPLPPTPAASSSSPTPTPPSSAPPKFPPPTLETLELLVHHHLIHVPFENLTFHYRPSTPLLSSPALLQKLLHSHRGGYCMETNRLLHLALVSLGYSCWPTGARTSIAITSGGKVRDEGWGGWGHECIIIDLSEPSSAASDDTNAAEALFSALEDNWYVVDVGFGGQGPVRPLRLRDGEEKPGVGRMIHRTVKRGSKGRESWVVQIGQYGYPAWSGDGEPGEKAFEWMDAFQFFPRMEWNEKDFDVLNFKSGQIGGPNPGFHGMFLFCVRLLTEQEVEEEVRERGLMEEETKGPGGAVWVLNQELKMRLGEWVGVVRRFQKEEERVETLRVWFGCKVEREGIRGGRMEIREAEVGEGKGEAERKKKEEGEGDKEKEEVEDLTERWARLQDRR